MAPDVVIAAIPFDDHVHIGRAQISDERPMTT
jgi:hypothetical protein